MALTYCLVWAWQEHKHASGQLGEEPAGQIKRTNDSLVEALNPKDYFLLNWRHICRKRDWLT